MDGGHPRGFLEVHRFVRGGPGGACIPTLVNDGHVRSDAGTRFCSGLFYIRFLSAVDQLVPFHWGLAWIAQHPSKSRETSPTHGVQSPSARKLTTYLALDHLRWFVPARLSGRGYVSPTQP